MQCRKYEIEMFLLTKTFFFLNFLESEATKCISVWEEIEKYNEGLQIMGTLIPTWYKKRYTEKKNQTKTNKNKRIY